MKIKNIPQNLSPRVGDIIEIEQGENCFEVCIIGITADGYLCAQDNIQGAVLLEGTALDHRDVADIMPLVEGLRDPKDNPCWKGYHPVGTKKKNGRTVPNCVPTAQEGISETKLDPNDPIVREYRGLLKQDIKSLRGLLQQQSRIIDVSGFTKRDAAVTYLRKKYGNAKVAAAFGLSEQQAVAEGVINLSKASDMAQQIAQRTNGSYSRQYGRTNVDSHGERSRDPSDYIKYSDKDSYDDAMNWLESKGKKVNYRNRDNQLRTAIQIGRFIVEPRIVTQGPFSDNPKTTYAVSVRSVKALSSGGRTRVDISDQQAAALHDIANSREEIAMQKLQAMMNQMQGQEDLQNIIKTSKKIRPDDKAKLDAIIAGAKNFQEDIAEAGPFSYGAKKPRKGSVADLADKKRREQEKNRPPIEPKDQMVGTAKLTKDVSETSDYFRRREREEAIISGQKPARKKQPAQTSDYARRREQEKKKEQGVKENQINELFDTYSDYYKLANGKRIKVDFRQALNADALPGTIKISYMDPRLKPSMGTSIDTPWDKAPPRIKQAIEKWVSTQPSQQGVAEGGQEAESDSKVFTVVYYSPRIDRTATKKIRASSESEVWDRLSEKGIDVVSVRQSGVTESGLQYYTGVKKHGAEYMRRAARAGREGASQEALGRLRDRYSKAYKKDAVKEEQLDEYSFADKKTYMKFLAAKVQKYGVQALRPNEREDLMAYLQAQRMAKVNTDSKLGAMAEAEYQGRKVSLGKPMAGDVKKSKVYVRKPNGKVVKVNFGDKTMKIKKSNPNRRKSFRARHNCENPGPRWKARYWSCRAW